MKKILKRILILFVIVVLAVNTYSAEENKAAKVEEPLHLLYVESGPYFGYGGTLYYLFEAMIEQDLLILDAPIPYSWGDIDTKLMWDFVSEHNTSDAIKIRKEDYYSFKNNEGSDQELLDRLSNDTEIDLLIVMGTVAGRTVTEGGVKQPMLVFSTSNALRSGIVLDAQTSKVENVWAHMELNRYKKQIEIFHDLFEFKKLGMVYEDSDNAKTFAAVEDVQELAAERGFEIVVYHVNAPADEADQDRYFREMLSAHKKLVNEVDAYYYTIAPLPGLHNKDLPEVMEPFINANIPVFSQFGQEDVERGVLMSLARKDFKEIGQFGVATMQKFMKGTPLMEIDQVFSETPVLAINVAVAESIEYVIPFRVLMVTDLIYQTVLDED